MNPLLLLAIGLAIVLGGILWLRLHPFLSLIVGAFAVGGLTSIENIQKSLAAKYEGENFRKAVNSEVIQQITEHKKEGRTFDESKIRENVRKKQGSQKDQLITAAKERASSESKRNTLQRITTAFGTTCGKIGILKSTLWN